MNEIKECFTREYVDSNVNICYVDNEINIDALITIDGYQYRLWEIIGIAYNTLMKE
jgi:hypothetical protein